MLANDSGTGSLAPLFLRTRRSTSDTEASAKRRKSSSASVDQTENDLQTVDKTNPIPDDEDTNGAFGGVYIEAFMDAINIVLATESYLFDNSELGMIDHFRLLTDDARKLYVRLFLRRRNKWFRLEQMKYKEISDLGAACHELIDHGFADSLASLEEVSLDDVLPLFSVAELKDMAKRLNCRGRGTKAELILALKSLSDAQSCLNWSASGLSILYDVNGRKRNFMEELLLMCMVSLGTCVMLKRESISVFERLHLVYFRARQFDETSLRTLILAKLSKRNFAKYLVCRSIEVFPTRHELLDYENSLKVQSEIDSIFDSGPVASRWESARDILNPVYEIWKERIKTAVAYSGERDHYLIRFSSDWVYTRMAYKLAYVLCRLGQYRTAHEVYSALLEQKIYRRGKRGDWYQQKALIENLYMCADKKNVKELHSWKQRALVTCDHGLQDPDTHLIYHYDLQKRIKRLERELRIPMRERHEFVHVALKEPRKRTFYGTKISETEIGKKTIWLDLKGVECSVEAMCLSNYEALGWKGFHTEGGIIKTIFAYVFWDVIFLPVPYIFETEFQNAPLDLATDAFYLSRASEINQRLIEIENGGAMRIIRAVYERESTRMTECIGLDWRFELQDVLESAECIGGHSLSAICKMFCEDYGHRSAGMPDLFLWNADQKKCLFSEVKSENDRLSDTQRLWIDVLIGAGVDVELCIALENVQTVE